MPATTAITEISPARLTAVVMRSDRRIDWVVTRFSTSKTRSTHHVVRLKPSNATEPSITQRAATVPGM